MLAMLMAVFGTVVATTGVAEATSFHNHIDPGTHMFVGDTIYSYDAQGDQVKLILQSDGNLVLYDYWRAYPNDATACWASNTAGYGSNVYAVNQLDGNFVLYYNSGGTRGTYAIWASATQGNDIQVKVEVYTTGFDSFRYVKLVVGTKTIKTCQF